MEHSFKIHNMSKETELQKIREKTKYYLAKYIQDNQVPEYSIFVGESLESAENYARKNITGPLSELVYVQEFPELFEAMMYAAEEQNKDKDSGQEK
jgi:alpha-amylase/alpha-mannosidase (GH57 family)